MLKALIAAHAELFPFTHDLQVLIDQLEDTGEVLPVFGIPLDAFTKFGVTVRYDSGILLSEAERQQYRQIVEDLRIFVTARVGLLP